MTSNTEIKRGLEGVVVDTTSISLVDGEAGVLSYRGVPIDDLVDAPFGEVAALVVDDVRSDRLAREVAAHAELSERERALVLVAATGDTHPMHVLQGMTPLLDRSTAFADRGEAAQGFAIAAKLPALVATHLRRDPCAKRRLWIRPCSFSSGSARRIRTSPDAPTA